MAQEWGASRRAAPPPSLSLRWLPSRVAVENGLHWTAASPTLENHMSDGGSNCFRAACATDGVGTLTASRACVKGQSTSQNPVAEAQHGPSVERTSPQPGCVGKQQTPEESPELQVGQSSRAPIRRQQPLLPEQGPAGSQ